MIRKNYWIEEMKKTKCIKCGKITDNATRVVEIKDNGEASVLYYCQDCESGITSDKFSDLDLTNLVSLFKKIFGQKVEILPVKPITEFPKCSKCGLACTEFLNNRKLGCPHCYEENNLKKPLDILLPKIHGGIKHVGKIPRHHKPLSVLKRELEDAIKIENYEEAAILRDKIKELESKELTS